MTDKIVGNLIETSNEAAGYSLGPSTSSAAMTDDDVRRVIEMLEGADRWAFQDQTLSLLKELLTLRARVAQLEAALLVDGTKLLARNAKLEATLNIFVTSTEAANLRVAQLEAALTAAQQLIRDLGSPQAADRLGSEFGLKDAPQ